MGRLRFGFKSFDTPADTATTIDNADYVFYVVVFDKGIRKREVLFIESGWEYRQDANDRLKELEESNEGTVRFFVAARRSMARWGLNPKYDSHWLKGDLLPTLLKHKR